MRVHVLRRIVELLPKDLKDFFLRIKVLSTSTLSWTEGIYPYPFFSLQLLGLPIFSLEVQQVLLVIGFAAERSP